MAARLTPRQYDLFLTRNQKLVVVIPVLMFVVFAIFIIIGFTSLSTRVEVRGNAFFFPYVPLAFLLGFAIFFLYTIASLPYRITVTADQSLVFKSFISERVVRPADLVSIEPRHIRIQASLSGYILQHRNGKILYPGQFTDMYILLAELKAANPTLEIRGC